MSYSSGLNENVVKTALDDVFDQTLKAEQAPGTATALTSDVFNQDTADSSAVIWEAFKGVGQWENKQEEQDVPQKTPRIGDTKTFTVTTFAASVDIPKVFFDDAKHSAYEKMVRNMARRYMTTRDSNAFAVFRNAFTTATTHDGVALISDSHTNLNGDTVDNNVGAALSETTLNTAIVLLLEMKSEDGVVDGANPTVLLVPPVLFKPACILVDSELRPDTGDNDVNVYSSKYGIRVYQSRWLGAAAGGSDTAWYLLGDTHSIYRFTRQGVETTLVPWQQQRNNNYIYKGDFREVVGAMGWEGIVGSAT